MGEPLESKSVSELIDLAIRAGKPADEFFQFKVAYGVDQEGGPHLQDPGDQKVFDAMSARSAKYEVFQDQVRAQLKTNDLAKQMQVVAGIYGLIGKARYAYLQRFDREVAGIADPAAKTAARYNLERNTREGRLYLNAITLMQDLSYSPELSSIFMTGRNEQNTMDKQIARNKKMGANKFSDDLKGTVDAKLDGMAVISVDDYLRTNGAAAEQAELSRMESHIDRILQGSGVTPEEIAHFKQRNYLLRPQQPQADDDED